MDTHFSHYVRTEAGTYHRYMRDESAWAVSAARLAVVARDSEDGAKWFDRACARGVVFW